MHLHPHTKSRSQNQAKPNQIQFELREPSRINSAARHKIQTKGIVCDCYETNSTVWINKIRYLFINKFKLKWNCYGVQWFIESTLDSEACIQYQAARKTFHSFAAIYFFFLSTVCIFMLLPVILPFYVAVFFCQFVIRSGILEIEQTKNKTKNIQNSYKRLFRLCTYNFEHQQ